MTNSYNLHIMNKFLILIMILVTAAGVCIVTCPDKESHIEAIKDALTNVLYEDRLNDDEELGLMLVRLSLETGVGEAVVDNFLQFDNWFICSVGTVAFEGKTILFSVGVMNHVFLPDMGDLIKSIEDIPL